MNRDRKPQSEDGSQTSRGQKEVEYAELPRHECREIRIRAHRGNVPGEPPEFVEVRSNLLKIQPHHPISRFSEATLQLFPVLRDERSVLGSEEPIEWAVSFRRGQGAHRATWIKATFKACEDSSCGEC